MSGDIVDLIAVATDDALITRVGAGASPEQVTTELERLLVAWRVYCHGPACSSTPAEQPQPTVNTAGTQCAQHRPNRATSPVETTAPAERG